MHNWELNYLGYALLLTTIIFFWIAMYLYRQLRHTADDCNEEIDSAWNAYKEEQDQHEKSVGQLMERIHIMSNNDKRHYKMVGGLITLLDEFEEYRIEDYSITMLDKLRSIIVENE